jgi:LCP family protein required for cell wall assembly
MPHRPEDDWTRPMPRTSRGSAGHDAAGPSWDDDWVTDRQRREQRYREPASDRTQAVPPDGRAGDHRDERWPDERYPRQDWSDERWQDDGWGPPPRRAPGYSSGGSRRPRYGLRRFGVVALLVVAAYVIAMIWAVTASYSAIDEVDATPTNEDRPGSAAGSNVLLVGTDSRSDLSREQRNELKTGHTEGSRADTIMLLHLPSGGEPTMVSLPRDSYVDIPGYGMNKINASYSMGGPPLLVDTVEQATDLPVDGYLEVGFDGFVDVVAAVGGVRMCLPEPVVEERSDLDLPAGCQDLEGKDALNYVRMRYSDPRGDLGRVERQREFLSSLVGEMTGPSTLFVPWRLHEAGTATGSSLRRGQDTSIWEMSKVALAMRSLSGGSGQSVTVPIADTNYATAAGSTVLWDEAGAAELFEALRNDDPITVEP